MVKATPMDVWKALGDRINKCQGELAKMHFSAHAPIMPVRDWDLITTAERLAFLVKVQDELRDMFQANTGWTREE